MKNGRLKLAIQKNGRLTQDTIELLKDCSLKIDNYKERLFVPVQNFPLDILFLRDDDIPEYVQDGVADLGIVGENIVLEKHANVESVVQLGFGKCTLGIGIPENKELNSIQELNGKTIATTYPNLLKKFLAENKINSKVIELSGSVEIAPSLGIADFICDLISTGNTLKLNKLKKSFEVLKSEAVLIRNPELKNFQEKEINFNNLLKRINSSLNAKASKYIMMNIPKSSLKEIINIIPSLKSPTILSLADENMLAIHAVIPVDTFWEIEDKLRNAGASGILLLPIENILL